MRCLSLALFSLFLSISVFANERIQITNGEWPPYLSESLPYYGFASHVVTKAFAAVGQGVDYHFFPWQRALEYAQHGHGMGNKWHGSLAWVYSEERAKNFYYSDSIITDTEVLFHLKSHPINWTKITDLAGKTIGGTQHTIYPTLEAAEKQQLLKIEKAGNYRILFSRLLAKRIDAIPQVSKVGSFFIRNTLTPQQIAQIAFSPTPLQTRHYHLILTRKDKNNAQLIKLFNLGLAKIKQNGTYQKLVEDFNQGVYEKPSH